MALFTENQMFAWEEYAYLFSDDYIRDMNDWQIVRAMTAPASAEDGSRPRGKPRPVRVRAP